MRRWSVSIIISGASNASGGRRFGLQFLCCLARCRLSCVAHCWLCFLLCVGVAQLQLCGNCPRGLFNLLFESVFVCFFSLLLGIVSGSWLSVWFVLFVHVPVWWPFYVIFINVLFGNMCWLSLFCVVCLTMFFVELTFCFVLCLVLMFCFLLFMFMCDVMF